MNMRHVVAVLLLPLAATGCARKNTLYEFPSDLYEVSFSATPTNTSAGLPASKSLPSDIRIAVFKDGTYVTSTTDQTLTLAGGTYSFYGYAPSALSYSSATNSVSGIGHGVDFIAAAAEDRIVSGSTNITLTFQHLCSKVSFTVKPKDGYTPVSLSVSKLALSDMAASPAGYTFGGAISPTSGTNTVEITSFTDNTGSTEVLPKTAGNFTLTVEMTVDGEDKTLTATVPNQVLEAGNHYTFNAIVKDDGNIDLTLTIVADWNVVDHTDEGIGTGQVGTVTNVTVVDGWKEVDWTEEIG